MQPAMMAKIPVILLTLTVFIETAYGQIDRLHCRNPLGMQDRRIPDDHLTASSFHAGGTGPNFARLEREEGDGAWCPKGVINAGDASQYLQVKLPKLSFLSIIATQGRAAGGKGQEYVPSYSLNYSRDGVTWFQWKNFRDVKVLGGNKDTTTIKRQKLNPGIPSIRFLRFIPVTSRTMAVCARVELYGCPMTSAVVSYSMPVPGAYDDASKSQLSENWSFDDEFYDGIRSSQTFHSGLGQLTDGVKGSDDINKVKSSVSTRTIGFDYVGWQNNQRGDRDITITFYFEDVRNFTSMRIHSHTSEIVKSRFFSNIYVSFSLNGRTFLDTPYASAVAYDVPGGNVDDTRFIVVPLGHAMARYVKATFRVRGEWMLISEIEFESDQLDRDPDPDLLYPKIPDVPVLQLPVTTQAYLNLIDGVYGAVSATMGDAIKNAMEGDLNYPSTEPSVIPTDPNNIAIIVCSLAGTIALLVLIVIFLICRHRRLKKTMSPPRYSYSAATTPVEQNPNVTLCLTDQRAAFTTTTCAMPEKFNDPLYHEIAAGRGIMSSNDYLEPNDVLRSNQRMPEVTQLAHQSMPRDRRFEQPDVTMCASGVRDGVMAVPHYAETSVRTLPPPYATQLQGAFGNNVYAVPWTSPSPAAARRTKHSNDRHLTPPNYTTTPSEASTLLADDSQDDAAFHTMTSQLWAENGAIEFPRERLEFIEKLGEGQFGEVRLCKADASLRRYVKHEGMTLQGKDNDPVLVAVKVLREDATPNAKDDFLKEVKVMAHLRDPNIVQLLAVCTDDEPYSMITEYMENGDLNEYLKGYDLDETSYRTHGKRSDLPQCSSQLPTISVTVLMSMAAQIAAGMKYLSSMNFVHRDLATRNCLVGKDHSIRIADFGMSRNMYQADYYKIQGKAVLPIRWMSWECILLGKFSTASDVWAFGITLWEIFTLCKCQPYHSLDDKQVIENMHHIYQRTGEEVYLPKPKACPSSVFNMIRQCWKRECDERPGFDNLYPFLKEKV